MASINDSDHADDWAAGGIHKRDFQHSHDGPEESPHRKKKGKAKPRKKKGCPASNGKAHVYVWIQYDNRRKRRPYLGGGMWDETNFTWIDETWFEKTCIGCEHVNNRRYFWGQRVLPEGIEVYEVRESDKVWYM